MIDSKKNASHWNRLRLPSRELCLACRRPLLTCYCGSIKPFLSRPRFVILTQSREVKHRLGTGRMAHLCIGNSLLIEGANFTHHEQVNAILRDPKNFAMILYPETSAIDLSPLSRAQRTALIPAGKELVVFVPDGTWTTARKMVGASENLRLLPFVSFSPPTASSYRIRRQPRPNMYCTLEAIHQVIELFADPADAIAGLPKPHDNLLEVLQLAVERQLSYTPQKSP